MRGSRARRPSHATVVAYIALFASLGGTALATHPGGQNTISTADIIDGQVKTADVGNGEVKTTDVGNGEVKTTDIGQAAVAADELASSSVGAQKIADGQVKVDEIATGAVRTDELQDGQVQAEDLAPGVAPRASGARAWGLVSGVGDLLRKKNVTAVTSLGQGIFCIDPGSGIDPTTAVLMVGEDFASSFTNEGLDDVSQVEWDSTPSACPAGTMEVRTFIGDGDPGTLGETDRGGFDLSEFSHGFTFVIP